MVKDRQGDCGGLFINRTEALRFAMFEIGNGPQSVVMVPGGLELDMAREAAAAHAPPRR